MVRPEELEEPSRNSVLILQMNVEACLLKSRQLCQQGRSEAEAEVHVAGWSPWVQLLKSKNEDSDDGAAQSMTSQGNSGLSLCHSLTPHALSPFLAALQGKEWGPDPSTPILSTPILTYLHRLCFRSSPEHTYFPLHP